MCLRSALRYVRFFCLAVAIASGVSLRGLQTPSRTARETRVCKIEDYRPQVIFEYVRRGQAWTSLVLLSEEIVLTNVDKSRRGLLRNGFLIGQAELADDLRTRTSKMILFDMSGNQLYSGFEKNFACPPEKPVGRCISIEIDFESDKLEGGPVSYSILQEPNERLYYERYGQRVSLPVWSREFKKSLDWLGKWLLKTELFPPLVISPKDRLKLVLAGDFYLGPYADGLEFTSTEDGWTVAGPLPGASHADRAKALIDRSDFDGVAYHFEYKPLPHIQLTPVGPDNCYGFFPK